MALMPSTCASPCAGSSTRPMESPPPSSITEVVTPNFSSSSPANAASARQKDGGEASV